MTSKSVKGLWIPGWSRDIQSIYTADPILLMSESRTCDVFFHLSWGLVELLQLVTPTLGGWFHVSFLGSLGSGWSLFLLPLLVPFVAPLAETESVDSVGKYVGFPCWALFVVFPTKCIGKEFKVVNYVDFGIIHKNVYAFLCFGIEFGSNWNLNMYSYMPILTKLSKRDLFWHHALILSHKDSHVLFATSLQFLLFFFCPILETFSIRLQVVNNLANSSKLQNRLVSPFVPLVFQIAKFTPTEPIFLWPRICHLQGQLLLWSHLEISRHYKTDMKEVWWNPSIAGSKHRILEPLVQVCWIFDYPRYMYSLNMPNLICSSEPEQVILNAFQRIGPDTLMGGLNC